MFYAASFSGFYFAMMRVLLALATRLASLMGAAILSMLLLLLPALRGREITSAGHAWLSPLLLTICALFVHGIGFVPGNAWLARLQSPALLWPLAGCLALVWWLVS